MKFRLYPAVMAATLGMLTPLAASAATVSLPVNTEMNVTIDQTLDSHSAQVGDNFSAHVQAPYPFDNQALAGAVVTGHITRVQHAGQGVKPEVDMAFDSIRLADGSTGPIDAAVTQANPKTQTKSGARVAISTLGGMLLGNAIAKVALGGAKGGGVAGAAGGFLIGNNYKADIQFQQGSSMTLKMLHTVAIRRQTSPH